MVAGGLIQAKLAYLLPLFEAAPDYLINGLQVQQLAAARVVVGHACFKWSRDESFGVSNNSTSTLCYY